QPTLGGAAAVESMRVWSGPDSTRVVFELTAPVEHRVFTLSDPERLVIDLPATTIDAPLSLPEPKGLVAAVRSGDRPSGELRVVLELTKAAKAKTFLLAPNEQYGHRLVVDLLQPETAPVVFRAAPTPEHGQDVVLAIARRLAQEIDAQPGMRSVLVRSGDYFVPHRKRMEIAHNAQADFFMSIHADSYHDSSATGATV